MKLFIYLFYSIDFQAVKKGDLNNTKYKTQKQEAVWGFFCFKTTNPFKSNLSEKEIKLAGNLSERKKEEEEEEEKTQGRKTREHTQSKSSFSEV